MLGLEVDMPEVVAVVGAVVAVAKPIVDAISNANQVNDQKKLLDKQKDNLESQYNNAVSNLNVKRAEATKSEAGAYKLIDSSGARFGVTGTNTASNAAAVKTAFGNLQSDFNRTQETWRLRKDQGKDLINMQIDQINSSQPLRTLGSILNIAGGVANAVGMAMGAAGAGGGGTPTGGSGGAGAAASSYGMSMGQGVPGMASPSGTLPGGTGLNPYVNGGFTF